MHYVLGQRVDALDYRAVTDLVMGWARARESRYVCISNVHMVMEGHDDPSFREVVNAADLVTADGMPLVWALKLAGVSQASRVRGPSLMPLVLAAAERENVPVGFYGSTPDIQQALLRRVRERYPSLEVAYAAAPPFRPLTQHEDDEIVREINTSGARIVFVGLGCPKQERWMSSHRRRVQAVLLGTGAAFDFFAGAKMEAPRALQQVGLEWLFRLASEPRRLLGRYVKHNPRFVFFVGRELLKR